MTEFGYILIIVFEVMFAVFILWGLISAEKRVKNCLIKANLFSSNLLNKVKILRSSLEKINEKTRNLKKINFKEIKEVSVLILDIINFILLIKSFNFKRGCGLHLRDVKKLIPFSLIKKFLGTIKTVF